MDHKSGNTGTSGHSNEHIGPMMHMVLDAGIGDEHCTGKDQQLEDWHKNNVATN